MGCGLSLQLTVTSFKQLMRPALAFYSTCAEHTWYLSMDFQFHLLSPLLLLPLWRSPRRGHVYIAAFLVATITSSFITSYWYQLPAFGLVLVDRSKELNVSKEYVRSNNRAASFLIGIIFGRILFKIKQQEITVKLSKILLGWSAASILFLGVMFSSVVFNDPDHVYDPWMDIIVHVISRPVVSLAVVWVIFACTTGYGGVVSKFLSWKGFLPLSRLTYSVYLVHYYVIVVRVSRSRSAMSADYVSLWYAFLADLVISFGLGACLYLTVETPVKDITDHFLKGFEPTIEKEEEKEPKTAKAESQVEEISITYC